VYRSRNRKHDRQFFYKYTTAAIAKTMLVNRTLRLSSPLLFNDPFDVSRVLRLPFNANEMSIRLSAELASLIRDRTPPRSSHNEIMRSTLEYALTLTDSQREYLANSLESTTFEKNFDQLPSFGEMQSVWDWMIPRERILCLTEENDNPVMWSNYADDYAGVVVELECIDIHDSILLLAEPVRYSNELPALGDLDLWVKMTTGQVPFDYDGTFRKLELTKTSKWSYEKEWRVLSFDKGSNDLYSDYKVHPQTFSRILMGNKISPSDRMDLMHLMSQDLSNLKGFEMRIDQASQKLAFDPITTT
jgi:hypothetical protein